MKLLKTLFFTTIIVACGVFGYISYQKNQKPALSKLAMANIEALTQAAESSGTILNCYDNIHRSVGDVVVKCSDCMDWINYDDDFWCLSSTCVRK